MDQQYDILKAELLLCQQQMDKYDNLSSTVRTWMITLWIASIGWFMQAKIKEILFLSIFIPAVFWIIDSMNKNFREDYKERRNEVAKILSDFFKTGTLPADVAAPQLPSHGRIDFIKKLFRLHIFPLYLSLIIIASVLLLLAH